MTTDKMLIPIRAIPMDIEILKKGGLVDWDLCVEINRGFTRSSIPVLFPHSWVQLVDCQIPIYIVSSDLYPR
jgi:hypothetical protein